MNKSHGWMYGETIAIIRVAYRWLYCQWLVQAGDEAADLLTDIYLPLRG
jgi:hypothetical protein